MLTCSLYVGDEDLATALRNYKEENYMGENVRRGEKMVEGILMSLGHRVTRQRIRDCICSLDPDGNDIRKICRLKRRVVRST